MIVEEKRDAKKRKRIHIAADLHVLLLHMLLLLRWLLLRNMRWRHRCSHHSLKEKYTKKRMVAKFQDT